MVFAVCLCVLFIVSFFFHFQQWLDANHGGQLKTFHTCPWTPKHYHYKLNILTMCQKCSRVLLKVTIAWNMHTGIWSFYNKSLLCALVVCAFLLCFWLAVQYCFGMVFPVWNVPAFCSMHANCPNGDGNQSSFGRVRNHYVNYRTTSKVMCIANRRTPYFTVS